MRLCAPCRAAPGGRGGAGARRECSWGGPRGCAPAQTPHCAGWPHASPPESHLPRSPRGDSVQPLPWAPLLHQQTITVITYVNIMLHLSSCNSGIINLFHLQQLGPVQSSLHADEMLEHNIKCDALGQRLPWLPDGTPIMALQHTILNSCTRCS